MIEVLHCIGVILAIQQWKIQTKAFTSYDQYLVIPNLSNLVYHHTVRFKMNLQVGSKYKIYNMTIRRGNILPANVHYRCVAYLQLSVQRFVFMWAKCSRVRDIKQRAKQTNFITMLSIEMLFPMKMKHIF